ncbi:MAG: hypothetical protein Q8L84_02650, partial [Hyphomonas sp.]|nr:hypothetical protein [Hyphomonas sp.]
QGVIIIEINDNPSIDHDVEGAVLKDEIWRRIISWFSTRLERRKNQSGELETLHVRQADPHLPQARLLE